MLGGPVITATHIDPLDGQATVEIDKATGAVLLSLQDRFGLKLSYPFSQSDWRHFLKHATCQVAVFNRECRND
jgi:predicted AAA+ superfamily ATPase